MLVLIDIMVGCALMDYRSVALILAALPHSARDFGRPERGNQVRN
jgi:hypothetical protein